MEILTRTLAGTLVDTIEETLVESRAETSAETVKTLQRPFNPLRILSTLFVGGVENEHQ